MSGWKSITIVALTLASVAGCSPAPAPGDAVSKCVASNFPSYNARDRDQCINACIKCENGVATTCATACSLKGAKERRGSHGLGEEAPGDEAVRRAAR